MKSYKVRANIDVMPNGKTEILYEIEPEVFVEEEMFVKWAKEKADVLEKEVEKAKTVGKKAKVKAFLKKALAARMEKKRGKEDEKEMLIEVALEASRVANDSGESKFFREQARERRNDAEKQLREKYGLERHYGGFRPIKKSTNDKKK